MVDMSKWIAIAKENIGKRPATRGRLAGKIAIVTGAAQGFGKGIAEEMHKEGEEGRKKLAEYNRLSNLYYRPCLAGRNSMEMLAILKN
jgi:hypothetical protein